MFHSYLEILQIVLTSAQDYIILLKKTWLQVFAFFAFSLFWLSLSNILYFYYRQVPALELLTSKILTELQTNYPEQLSISWDGTTLNSSGTPQAVSYPSGFEPEEYQLPAHLSLILPTEASPHDLEQSTALTVITPTQVHVRNQANQWSQSQLMPLLKNFDSFTINSVTIPSLIEQTYQSVTQFLKFMTVFLTILSPVWLIISKTWEALLNSLMIYVVLKLFQNHLSWAGAFKLALYLTVPAEVIFQITRWLYPSAYLQLPIFSISFWMLFALLFLLHRRELRD